MGRAPEQRLALMEQYAHLVDQRDDFTVERLSLLNILGRHSDALDVLMSHMFHPWEGGEGKVAGQYVATLVELARAHLQAGQYNDAVAYLQRALDYPPNLGEGKLGSAQSNQIFYYLGLAYLHQPEQARECFVKAASGSLEISSPMYYNDQPPDMILYQGLARRRLGQSDEAQAIFKRMAEYGQAHLNDRVVMDYFAVSLPDFLVFDDDLQERNQLHCRYMIALGSLGLGDAAEAQRQFDWILLRAPHHLGAVMHRRLLHDMTKA
jgi:tetratricopeptide (TPR) repeat protein